MKKIIIIAALLILFLAVGIYIFEVTLDNPRVNMTNGSNRVNAGLDVALNIKIGQEIMPLGGFLDVSGGVKYISENGAFYLSDPVIEKLSVHAIPSRYENKVNLLLTKVLEEYYATHPIYTLKNRDLKQAAAKIVLKDVAVENEYLVLTFGV